MFKERWFKIGIGIIMFFIIIFLGTKVSFVFQPIVIMFQTLFPPILLAGVLFYLLRPPVNLLSKKMPRSLAILIIFIAIIGILTGLVFLVGPELQKQFNHLVVAMPGIVDMVQQWILTLSKQEWFINSPAYDYLSIDRIISEIESNAEALISNIGSIITGAVGAIANTVMVLLLVPFVLFYMLKDGNKTFNFLNKVLPKKYVDNTESILKQMDTALSSYITGQLTVSLFVGVCAYIGYLFIGLEYSLVLGVVSMVTNVIPFLGPWIGTIPAVIVGLFQSPLHALLVIIIAVVVQQLESNLISPQVMGRALNMHPLTIIFVILVAGQIGGLLWLILAVPTYAILKVIVINIYRYIRLIRTQ